METNDSQTHGRSDVIVVVPAFNESAVVAESVRGIQAFGHSVIVVDDGSTDNTSIEAKAAGALVVRHPVNLGQGAAIATGIQFAVTSPNLRNWRYLVTFDADGQHDATSIDSLCGPLRTGVYDIVFGTRFWSGGTKGIRFSKRALLRLAVMLTRATHGLPVTDAHNGFRAMTRRVCSQIRIQHAGMAHASEFLSETKRHSLRYLEFPVEIRYTSYSKTKGQSSWNAINILFDLALKK